MTPDRMDTLIPFSLDPDTGALSISGPEATLSPGMSIRDIEALGSRFPSMIKGPVYPGTDLAYQIHPVKLPNERWFYVNLGFSNGALKVVGFGWGTLRGGFYELTVPEFQEQLCAFRTWLESVLGPSLPCSNPRQVYCKELDWGTVEALSDARTGLPGIGIQFKAFPKS